MGLAPAAASAAATLVFAAGQSSSPKMENPASPGKAGISYSGFAGFAEETRYSGPTITSRGHTAPPDSGRHQAALLADRFSAGASGRVRATRRQFGRQILGLPAGAVYVSKRPTASTGGRSRTTNSRARRSSWKSGQVARGGHYEKAFREVRVRGRCLAAGGCALHPPYGGDYSPYSASGQITHGNNLPPAQMLMHPGRASAVPDPA